MKKRLRLPLYKLRSIGYLQDIRLLIPTSSYPYFLYAFGKEYSFLLKKSTTVNVLYYRGDIPLISPFMGITNLPSFVKKATSILGISSPIYCGAIPSGRLCSNDSFEPVVIKKEDEINDRLMEEAKPYITYGTRVVDLDGQHIYVNMPTEELDDESVPTPILDFFGVEFSDRNRFLKSAMTTKSSEFARWKTSKLPVQNYLVHQAEPFFSIIVNLLGTSLEFTRDSIRLQPLIPFKKAFSNTHLGEIMKPPDEKFDFCHLY
ncbi:hypothetical protein ACTXT7_013047 [Hymenolepis weldensis]